MCAIGSINSHCFPMVGMVINLITGLCIPSRSLTASLPLKSYHNPIGKDRLPTTIFKGYVKLQGCTWRINPVSKWLGSPPFISHETAICKGSHNPRSWGLTITMILQVPVIRIPVKLGWVELTIPNMSWDSTQNPPMPMWIHKIGTGIFTYIGLFFVVPPPKTNMTMEHPPFEDAFPIENCDFPMSC